MKRRIKTWVLSVLLSYSMIQSVYAHSQASLLADFFGAMNITDVVTQHEFSEYYASVAYKVEKKSKKRQQLFFDQLHSQALCNMEIYHPEWVEKVDVSFLTLYGLLDRYQRSSYRKNNGTLFRLSSYFKDSVRTVSGWFKTASLSSQHKQLRSTERSIA